MMRTGAAHRYFAGVMIMALLGGAPIAAAQKSAAPVGGSRGFFALPVELDLDSGAANGDAAILRIMPLYTFPVAEKWRLVHLDIITLADAPGGLPAFPGDRSFGQTRGVSDLLHASFVTPKTSGDFLWSLGAMIAAPTASDESLGSGKWAAGPALRVTYRKGLWNFGLIGGQRWSFAGSSNRGHVNQLLLRGAIRRQLEDGWYFVSAPLITVNWDTPGENWLVPVGGGIGRRFTFGGQPWAWSVQGYYNVVKAEPAPDWVFRLAIVAAIPFGD